MEDFMRTFLALVMSAFLSLGSLGASADEAVTYKVNGAEYEGFFVKAEGESKGLVIIVHDWDGLTDYEKERARMIAEMGYDAFAVDVFGKGVRPDTLEARRAETGKLYKDREALRARLMAGYEQARKLSDNDAVVIGYCFGGAAALELARSGKATNVKGFVSFHGGLATPEGQSYPASTPPLLILHGGADPVVKMSEVANLAEELEKAGVEYEIQVYSGAPHAFTVFDSKDYRELADAKSWNAFLDFLEERLNEG